jgi:hypothetical protein
LCLVSRGSGRAAAPALGEFLAELGEQLVQVAGVPTAGGGLIASF